MSALRPERGCLTADTQPREEDRAGPNADTLDQLHGVELPLPHAAWDWDWDWEIAPFGEADGHPCRVNRVHADRDRAMAGWHP